MDRAYTKLQNYQNHIVINNINFNFTQMANFINRAFQPIKPKASSMLSTSGTPAISRETNAEVINSTVPKSAANDRQAASGLSDRLTSFFKGGRSRSIDSVPNDVYSGQFEAKSVLDAKDYSMFNGDLLASENLDAVSVDQVDCFIEPGSFFQKIIDAHAPTRVSIQPMVATFDETGALSVTGASGNSGILQLETTSASVTQLPGYKQLGWFFRLSRFNTDRGKSAIQIATNAIRAAYDFSDLDSEAKLVVLNTSIDTVVKAVMGTPTVDSTSKAVELSPLVSGAQRDLTAYLDVAALSDSTLASTAIDVRGQNVNVYVYPIIVTREVSEFIARNFAEDNYHALAKGFLSYI